MHDQVSGDAVVVTEPTTTGPALLPTIVVAAGLWVAVTTTIGLVAAFVGMYQPLVVAALGLVGAGLLLRHAHLLPIIGRRTDGWDWAALALSAAIGAWTSNNLGQHIVTERDGGSYITTARWLARAGSLSPDVVDTSIFGEPAHLILSAPAVYSVGDGHAEFQFNHGMSIIQAIGFELLGARGLFVTATAAGLLALLALFLVMRDLRTHPAIALGAMAALAVSLPMQFIMRDGYSETFVMQAIWVAVLLAGHSSQCLAGEAARRWFVVGIVIGAVTCYRADGLLYVIATCSLLMIFVVRRWAGGHDVVWFVVGAVAPIAVGMIDFWMFSGGYADLIGREAALLAIGAAITASVAMIASSPAARRAVEGGAAMLTTARRQRLGAVGGATMAVLLVLAAVVRPIVQTQRRPSSTADPSVARVVGQLQDIQGLPIEPTRMYAELSLRQLTWYFGWGAVILGSVGIGLLLYRAITTSDRVATIFTCAFIVAGPLYIADPRITPDQVWATRRLMPLVVAAFIVAAAYSLTAAIRLSARAMTTDLRRWGASGLVVAGVCVLLVPSMLATWPVRRHADFRGMYPVMDAVCSYVGDDAATLSVSKPNFDMALRAWCGTESATAGGQTLTSAIDTFARPTRSDCRERYLVTLSDVALPDGVDVVESRDFGGEFSLLSERRLIGAPDDYWTQRFGVTFHRLATPASCR